MSDTDIWISVWLDGEKWLRVASFWFFTNALIMLVANQAITNTRILFKMLFFALPSLFIEDFRDWVVETGKYYRY